MFLLLLSDHFRWAEQDCRNAQHATGGHSPTLFCFCITMIFLYDFRFVPPSPVIFLCADLICFMIHCLWTLSTYEQHVTLHTCWCMDVTLRAHMLPVKTSPLFWGGSGRFHIIAAHSDTLTEVDCSVPRQPRRDHPPSRRLFILLGLGLVALWLAAPGGNLHKRLAGLLFPPNQYELLESWVATVPVKKEKTKQNPTHWSGVIIGHSDAQCCYRQMGALQRRLQCLTGTTR